MMDLMVHKLSLLDMMNETKKILLFSSISQLLIYVKRAWYSLTYLER